MRGMYTGVVENRDDPLKLGRCQVRIVGLHTDDKTVLPTEELPWAFPMAPITSASMNGIGWTPVGPVPGTWVVIMFHDEEEQMPVMIGTIGGIPQSKAAERVLDNSDSLATDGGVLTDAQGNPVKSGSGAPVTVGANIPGLSDTTNNALGQIANALGFGNLLGNIAGVDVKSPAVGADNDDAETITPKIVPKDEVPIAAQPEPGKATDQVLSTGIPVDPPAKYARTQLSEKRRGIKALIDACDKVGLTSKYAKCAILGICGGESQWMPVEEGHSYAAESLLKVFPGVFKGDIARAQQYARWKGSKADFFREIYSPKYPNGKNAGNKLPDDGALFYGRGFNQITGRSLYEQLERELKKLGYDVPISKRPEILNIDYEQSALCTAMFYKLNVKADQNNPAYFQAALKRTGNPVGDSYEKKRVIYEYFLGQGVITDSTNKPTADQDRIYSKEEVANLPPQKQAALLEDRSDAKTIGFQDPMGKYPLRNLLDEPDTNRLARGVIQDTAIPYKDQTRTQGISTANDSDGSWEQPLAPFGGVYPYNKVYESESGHLQVFDDTPGHETVSLYHRKGTFIDMDANGTQVNKIIGDGYTIIDRNGMIAIQGRCNIFVGNNASILVQGSADIEVNGATTANFHGQVDIGCAQDVNWAIGGDFNLKVDGNVNTNVKGNVTTAITGNETIAIKGNTTRKTTGTTAIESVGAITHKASAAFSTEVKGAYNLKSDDEAKIAGKVLHLKATGGNVNVDGTQFRGQQGSSVAPSAIEGDGIPDQTPLGLEAPEVRAGSGNTFEVLTTPVRPAPPADIKLDVLSASNAATDDYIKNPGKYSSSDAVEAGVGTVRPQPDLGDPKSFPAENVPTGDIQSFLRKQIALAKEGHWSETGMTDKSRSNKNILAIWKDIGLEKVANGTDQTAWCMAFVVWVLKQNGYRYAQTARAADISERTKAFNCTKVTSDPQPGDICHWKYGAGNHVNFVYEILPGGKFTLVGGNQTEKNVKNNNPSGGSVTVSWPGGTTMSNPQLVGIYRPSKT